MKHFIALLVIAFAVYLVGSFIEYDLNADNWSEFMRGILAFTTILLWGATYDEH